MLILVFFVSTAFWTLQIAAVYVSVAGTKNMQTGAGAI